MQSDSGECTRVPLSQSAVLKLDLYGNFDNSVDYVDGKSMFAVEFFSYKADDASYIVDMTKLESHIHNVFTTLQSAHDLPVKINLLTSWRDVIKASYEDGGDIQIWFDADPAFMFDFLDSQALATFGLGDKDCHPNGWSYSSGVYSIYFRDIYDTHLDRFNWNCTLANGATPLSLEDLGFHPEFESRDFQLNIDVRTAITISSLNQGIIQESDLTVSTDKLHHFGEAHIELQVLFDRKYPDMDPIYKDTDSSGTVNYYMRFGRDLFRPEFDGYYYLTASEGGHPNATSSAQCPGACESSPTLNFCGRPDFVFKV